ncbi:MAG TPA: MarR family winged helix-turn-helix transcriptional regulator, partial [Solirubrobacteraceae bacterium]|jgi:DNA-binding MarR family transcriptional regulator|nr:MarR family winged helix-turn-helix transcriptional regulator [Solirubrobacteraceae bacterium]
MAVKSKPETDSQPSVEEALTELTSLMPITLHDLKDAVPAPMPMRDAMERSSLGKRHASALLAVAATEPIGVSELAKRLGLLLSSTSTIVGELSRAGLVERAEDDQDRRRTIVRVHEDYRDAMEGWLEIALAPMRNALERLSPQARGHFMQGWRVLGEEAAAHAEHASTGEVCDP